MRKFSTLYGMGFGLGMCAPTISQLGSEFIKKDPAMSVRKPSSKVAMGDADILAELESLKQELVLRSQFKQ